MCHHCPLWCAICRHILWNVLLERCAKALKTNKPFSSLQPSNWTKTKTYDVWNCNKISKIPRGSKGALASPTILVSYNRAPRKKNCRIFTLMDFKAALGLISSRGLLVICSKYARETHQPFWASSAIDHFSTVRWLGLCPTTYVKWLDYYLHHYSPWNHLRRNQLPN